MFCCIGLEKLVVLVYYSVPLLGCCVITIEIAILIMVTGDIKVTRMVSTGIRITKGITRYVLSNGNYRIQTIC